MNKNNEWAFTVTSGTAIDFCSICDDLSYAIPLASFEYQDDTFVVVHESLIQKAAGAIPEVVFHVTQSFKDAIDVESPCSNGVVVVLKEPEDLATVKAWAKVVKGAPWAPSLRGRGKIVVTSYQV